MSAQHSLVERRVMAGTVVHSLMVIMVCRSAMMGLLCQSTKLSLILVIVGGGALT